MELTASERALIVLLRVVGALTAAALVAVVLPSDWMAGVHRWLGLGEFPEQPSAEYLARSLSLFYAVLGVLLWRLSSDVRRFAPLIGFLARSGLVVGAVLLAVDVLAGLPVWWIVSEAVSWFGISGAVLLLRWKQPSSSPPERP